MTDARLKPKQIRGNPCAWWYEDARGIDVIHEIRDNANNLYTRTDHIRIPWSHLAAAMRRSYRKRAKR